MCYVKWMPWILPLEVEERFQTKTGGVCCVLFGVDDLKFGIQNYCFCSWVIQHFSFRSRDCSHMHEFHNHPRTGEDGAPNSLPAQQPWHVIVILEPNMFFWQNFNNFCSEQIQEFNFKSFKQVWNLSVTFNVFCRENQCKDKYTFYCYGVDLLHY